MFQFLERTFHERRPQLGESGPENFASLLVRAAPLSIPDYFEHRDGATEIGKLTAAAIVREYEAAAKDIEEMGSEPVKRARQCEAMTRDG